MATAYATLIDAFDDNADYSTTGSVVKCKAFIVACRRLKRFATRTGQDGAESEFSPEFLTDELAKAESWLAQNDTGGETFGSVKHVDFSEMRG